jgi:hypothetical protein
MEVEVGDVLGAWVVGVVGVVVAVVDGVVAVVVVASYAGVDPIQIMYIFATNVGGSAKSQQRAGKWITCQRT